MSEPLFEIFRFLTDRSTIWIFSTQKSNPKESEVPFLRSNWIFQQIEPCAMSSYLNIELDQDHWMLHNDCDKYGLKKKILILYTLIKQFDMWALEKSSESQFWRKPRQVHSQQFTGNINVILPFSFHYLQTTCHNNLSIFVIVVRNSEEKFCSYFVGNTSCAVTSCWQCAIT